MPDNALIIRENHDIEYSGFRLHKNGLSPIGSPTYEQWEECGAFIKKANGSVQFWIGDWVRFGEAAYGEMYSQALDSTGLEYHTIANDKWVADKVDISRRRENLTFDHHKEIAKLEPKDQDILLDKAEVEHIPTKEFRQTVKDYVRAKERAKLPKPDPSKFANKVINGDCLIEMAKLADKSVDMIYVDPPYNYGKGEWDKYDAKEFIEFTTKWMTEVLRVIKPSAHLFINFSSDGVYWLQDLILTTFSLIPSSTLIWHYRNAGGKSSGKTKFSKTYEPILHYCFGNKELNFPDEWDDQRFDVWTIAVPQSNFDEGKDHPTQKPIELMERLVRFGSLPGEKVLDPMAGAGTTGVAALKNDRDFILIEQSLEYVDTIHRRLNEL